MPNQNLSTEALYGGFAEGAFTIEALFRRLDGLPNDEKRRVLSNYWAYGIICEITYQRLLRELGLKS